MSPSANQLAAFLRDVNQAQARHGIRLSTKGAEMVALSLHEQPKGDNYIIIRPKDPASVQEELDATLVVA